MEIAFLVGRIIVGIYFLENAYNHLFKSAGLAGYAASKKVPAPKAAVIFSGLLLLVGGLSVILGVWTTAGIICLLVFMIPVTIMMHNFWKMTDPNERMNEQITFMKNVAIIGFLLMSLAISLPWPYSVGM